MTCLFDNEAMTTTKSTHSERVAVALAMRTACAAACAAQGKDPKSDDYRKDNDRERYLASVIDRVDAIEVVAHFDSTDPPSDIERAEFERVARGMHFPIAFRDGDYFHDSTRKAWKIWQAARDYQKS